MKNSIFKESNKTFMDVPLFPDLEIKDVYTLDDVLIHGQKDVAKAIMKRELLKKFKGKDEQEIINKM